MIIWTPSDREREFRSYLKSTTDKKITLDEIIAAAHSALGDDVITVNTIDESSSNHGTLRINIKTIHTNYVDIFYSNDVDGLITIDSVFYDTNEPEGGWGYF